MAAAESYVSLVRLLPTVFLAWLAWAVARSPYRAAGNRRLSAFFALVGLGFLLEFLADFAQPLSPALARLLGTLGLAAGVVDPLLLLAFALGFPEPRPAARAVPLWAACGAGALAALYAELAGGFVWALPAYVDLAYLASFALLLDAYLRERHRFRERQLFFVVLGVGFAALSRSAALFFERPPTATPSAWFVFLSGMAVALALAAPLYAWAARKPVRERGHPLFLRLLALLVGFAAAHALVYSVPGFGFHVASQYFGLRWLVVGGILGYGILRYQLFDFELRTRQAVTFLASLVVGVVAAFAAALLADDAGSGPALSRAIGVAAGVVATLAAYAALAVGWRRLQPGAELPARYRQRRIELYEAALEYALPDAQWTLADHLFADTLREVFQISPAEHEQVMRQLAARPPA